MGSHYVSFAQLLWCTVINQPSSRRSLSLDFLLAGIKQVVIWRLVESLVSFRVLEKILHFRSLQLHQVVQFWLILCRIQSTSKSANIMLWCVRTPRLYVYMQVVFLWRQTLSHTWPQYLHIQCAAIKMPITHTHTHTDLPLLFHYIHFRFRSAAICSQMLSRLLLCPVWLLSLVKLMIGPVTSTPSLMML